MNGTKLRSLPLAPRTRIASPSSNRAHAAAQTNQIVAATPPWIARGFIAPAYSSCQGVRMRGPSSVTATVNSKWAASDPSAE